MGLAAMHTRIFTIAVTALALAAVADAQSYPLATGTSITYVVNTTVKGRTPTVVGVNSGHNLVRKASMAATPTSTAGRPELLFCL